MFKLAFVSYNIYISQVTEVTVNLLHNASFKDICSQCMNLWYLEIDKATI